MGYLDNLFQIEGKRAVLSGAGGLLVGEMARSLASAGAEVAVLDATYEAAEKVRDEIISCGGRAIAIKTDVTKKPDWQNALQQVVSEFGGADILVNGAGANAPTPFLEIDVDEWDHILRVQLTGTMLGCQVYWRAHGEAGQGQHYQYFLSILGAASFQGIHLLGSQGRREESISESSPRVGHVGGPRECPAPRFFPKRHDEGEVPDQGACRCNSGAYADGPFWRGVGTCRSRALA